MHAKFRFAIFAAAVALQLAVPAMMIANREDAIENGAEYRFKTAPVDPNDPFRGKYVYLDFEAENQRVPTDLIWRRGEKVYVTFRADEGGFAVVDSIYKTAPNKKAYLETEISNFIKNAFTSRLEMRLLRSPSNVQPPYVQISLPFDRFYLEEHKAPEAERIYAQTVRDTAKVSYALVSVKDGEAVLRDLVIDGKPIGEILSGRGR
jgi:uncharacterized membrane-anchored protein